MHTIAQCDSSVSRIPQSISAPEEISRILSDFRASPGRYYVIMLKGHRKFHLYDLDAKRLYEFAVPGAEEDPATFALLGCRVFYVPFSIDESAASVRAVDMTQTPPEIMKEFSGPMSTFRRYDPLWHIAAEGRVLYLFNLFGVRRYRPEIGRTFQLPRFPAAMQRIMPLMFQERWLVIVERVTVNVSARYRVRTLDTLDEESGWDYSDLEDSAPATRSRPRVIALISGGESRVLLVFDDLRTVCVGFPLRPGRVTEFSRGNPDWHRSFMLESPVVNRKGKTWMHQPMCNDLVSFAYRSRQFHVVTKRFEFQQFSLCFSAASDPRKSRGSRPRSGKKR